MILSFSFAFLMLWVNESFASGPGDLDTSFNSTGIVTTSINNSIDAGFSVAIQPDSKLVVAGAADNIENFAVIRYNPDGSLDSDFNVTGIVTTSISGGWEEFGSSLVLQPDKKIVVAGTGARAANGPNDFAIVRYNENGSLDTSFNSTGIVTTHIGIESSIDIGRAVALQSDGKVVVGGESTDLSGVTPESAFTVVRYNQNGSLDPDFNSTGIITTSVGEFDSGRSIYLQLDGKIIVAGKSSSQITVLRYTTTGELDTEFNSTGIVTTAIGTSSEGTAAIIQADGKIVVAGSSNTGTSTDFTVVRYNSDGSLDNTFNSTGIVTTSVSSGVDRAQAVALQLNHKIVVAGVSNFDTDTGNFAVVRYDSNGNLDTTFGNGGIITTSITSYRDEARDISIQSDGRIVAVGFEDIGGTDANFAVVRYHGDAVTYLPIILKVW